MKNMTAAWFLTLALIVGGSASSAWADTADAKCEVRKHGDKIKDASGACSFSQRQGYIDIRLRNGDSYSLSPTDKPNHYKDQHGDKVVRDGDEYKWDHRKIFVIFGGSKEGDDDRADAGGSNETPRDLRDLVGGRRVGGEVEDEMTKRGYEHVKDEPSGSDVYSYWWGHKQCVTVRLDGARKVASIVTGPSVDCKK